MAESLKLPRRSAKYGVGKEIGGAIYVHRNYEGLLGSPVSTARERLPRRVDYTIVKYNFRTGAVSFIHSPDFDTAPEPTVAEVWTVSSNGRVSFRKPLSDPPIYHHKWLFVADDYDGFSIEESITRSWSWLSLRDVDRRRIGQRSYWTNIVLPRLQADRS